MQRGTDDDGSSRRESGLKLGTFSKKMFRGKVSTAMATVGDSSCDHRPECNLAIREAEIFARLQENVKETSADTMRTFRT